MHGKVCLITGATRGIGRAGALELARAGADLILVGRDLGRLEDTATACRTAGASRVTIHLTDLSSRKQVAELARTLITTEPQVDVLWNNAGGYFTERVVTAEGLERTWAMNHLAYFDLTQALFLLLEKSEDPRIICTASEAHRLGKLQWDNLQGEKKWNGWRSYCLTKLTNLLYVAEQARRLGDSKIRICAMHPGLVNSSLGDKNRGWAGITFLWLKKWFGRSNEKGADTAVWLASREKRPTQGGYYANRKEKIPSPEARNVEDAGQLWQVSRGSL